MILGKNFSNLKVILVEPNGPLNVGSVARLCSNFEVDELRIVSPKCDIFSLEAKKMALKGQEFLDFSSGNPLVLPEVEKLWRDCTTRLLATPEYSSDFNTSNDPVYIVCFSAPDLFATA